MPVKKEKSDPLRKQSEASKRKAESKNTAEKLTSALKADTKYPKKETDNKIKRVPKRGLLSVPVYSLAGISAGNLDLPKEVFGAKINKALLAQAIRIYINNLSGHFSHTKTRGEVEGSTRKIFKQKGTGRARHGAVRAPIFVGGGIALGPKSRKVTLNFPDKMKKAALISALSQKIIDNEILGISGLDKASGKTKEMAKLMTSFKRRESDQKTGSFLFVGDKSSENAKRALRNIPSAGFSTAEELNALDVARYKNLIFTKDAVLKLQERLTGKGEVKTQ